MSTRRLGFVLIAVGVVGLIGTSVAPGPRVPRGGAPWNEGIGLPHGGEPGKVRVRLLRSRTPRGGDGGARRRNVTGSVEKSERAPPLSRRAKLRRVPEGRRPVTGRWCTLVDRATGSRSRTPRLRGSRCRSAHQRT